MNRGGLATLTLINSTVSGNAAGNAAGNGGGGIYNEDGTAELANSTVSSNTTTSNGGGISNAGGTVTIDNTIVANSLAGDDCAGVITVEGNNFVESPGACVIVGSGTANGGFDPLLGPLANNGGPTQTHALLAGSPAIDAGSADCPPPATDQRGVARPQGPACDIGSVEVVQDTTPPDTTINSAVDGNGASLANGGSTLSGSITFTFGGTDDVGVTGFECSLDGAAFAPCASPTDYSALAIGSHTFQVRALDAAGNVDPSPASFTWTIVTPAQAVQNLVATINGMGLPAGVANNLIAPLHQASALLNDNNPNNDIAACKQLDAFITRVTNSKQLTPGQVSQLLQAANAIKASLGC